MRSMIKWNGLAENLRIIVTIYLYRVVWKWLIIFEIIGPMGKCFGVVRFHQMH